MSKKSKHDIWLTDGEDLLCAAEEGGGKQPKILLLTNKRLILVQEVNAKEWSDVDDKMWKQFCAVKLTQGFWSSTLAVTFSVPTDEALWTFHKIKKDVAAQAYRLMKNREVAMREAGKAPPAVAPKPAGDAPPADKKADAPPATPAAAPATPAAAPPEASKAAAPPPAPEEVKSVETVAKEVIKKIKPVESLFDRIRRR